MSQVLTPPKMDPKTASDDEVLAAALAWSQEFKPCKRLPIGVRGKALTCPLSKATGLFVGHYTAYEHTKRPAPLIDLPPLVAEFVRRFDEGELPHLDADRQGE